MVPTESESQNLVTLRQLPKFLFISSPPAAQFARLKSTADDPTAGEKEPKPLLDCVVHSCSEGL